MFIKTIIFSVIISPILSFASSSFDDFVRVEESEGSGTVRTAYREYRKGDSVIAYFAVYHNAESAFFERLISEMEKYDFVLYEFRGNLPNTNKALKQFPACKEALILTQAKWIAEGLEDQILALSTVDFGDNRFVHADEEGLNLTLDHEFCENWLTEIRGKSGHDSAASALSWYEKFPKNMRLVVAESIQKGMVKWENGLEKHNAMERDEILLAKLEEKLKINPNSKILIPRGLAHGPRIQDYILELGYTQTNMEWLRVFRFENPKPLSADL